MSEVPNFRSYPRTRIPNRRLQCQACMVCRAYPFKTQKILRIQCGDIYLTRIVTLNLLYCGRCHTVTHTGETYDQIKQAMREIIDE